MWTTWSEELADPRGRRFVVNLDRTQATFADVVRGWQGDLAFRSWFLNLLADSPFSAFRWETPPVTTASWTRPFEFVLLDSPALARRPDPSAFAEHFVGEPASGVVTFSNLGGDAILIVPAPHASASAYGHLAAFVREAPESQRHAFWRTVGNAMAQRLSDKPVWLNTAGAGVSWLHARLDDRPKYYGFGPYRQSNFHQ